MDNITSINAGEICSDSRTSLDGRKRYVTRLLSATIGRGIYNPGWRWSIHAGPQLGKESARHFGWVKSRKMMVLSASNDEVEVGPGHDACVEEDEPCVALGFET